MDRSITYFDRNFILNHIQNYYYCYYYYNGSCNGRETSVERADVIRAAARRACAHGDEVAHRTWASRRRNFRPTAQICSDASDRSRMI